MSYKNILQEYCQKNKLGTPLDNTKSEGPHHKLELDAAVSLPASGMCVSRKYTICF